MLQAWRKFSLFLFIIGLCFKGLLAHAQNNAFSSVRDLNQNGKVESALGRLEKIMNDSANGEEQTMALLGHGILSQQMGNYEKAEKSLKSLLEKDRRFADIAYYHLGLIESKKGQNKEAKENFKNLLKEKPNFQILSAASVQLADILIAEKKYADARALLLNLERRIRSEDFYPEVLQKLIVTERRLGSKLRACRYARTLYTKFPTHLVTANWSQDLHLVEVEGEKLGCIATMDDLSTRLRFFQLNGEDQRAFAEVEAIKKRGQTNIYIVDRIYAQILAQSGEPQAGLEVLLKHYKDKRGDINYMIRLGGVAARAGEAALSIGSYYKAHKISPKSRAGVEALFQSAFMSYQVQDYDGAARRFQEVIQVAPNSRFGTDAIWHLAWLKYLKSDFEGAYRAFQQMEKLRKDKRRRFSSFDSDRLRYWMGMSLLRQSRVEEARVYFDELSQNPLRGYYSIVAQQRLNEVNELAPQIAAKLKQDTVIQPYLRQQMLFPSDDHRPYAGEYENQDVIFLPDLASEEEVLPEETTGEVAAEATDAEAQSPEIQNGKLAQSSEVKIEEEPIRVSPFKDPKLAARFDRARVFRDLGFDEWAKWELYEIEKRTSNREYLRTLMDEYHRLGNYNRAASIGQIVFGRLRAKDGISGARDVWELTYPQAYLSAVKNTTQRVSVQQELIWAIMRAESLYKKEALSPVGAIGLMQVMPYTGARVAAMMGEKDFEARQLFEPDTVIRIGGKYLERLNKKFSNEAPLVAAAYNAGPHRVKRWLSNFGHLDMDEFIEHIPFSETRNYVKKVVSNYQIYAELYNKKTSLVIPLAGPIETKVTEPVPVRETWEDI